LWASGASQRPARHANTDDVRVPEERSLLVRPDGQFIAAGFDDWEPSAAGEGEDVADDFSSQVDHPLPHFLQPRMVENNQNAAARNRAAPHRPHHPTRTLPDPPSPRPPRDSVPAPAPRAASTAMPSTPDPRSSDVDDATYLRGRALMVPVLGVTASSLHDSFLARRGSARVHHAVDILAARGTPVLAADDGRVLRMRSNALGGITVYALDAGERFVYYYAHLERYAATLSEGKIVSKGEVIGYVGMTGLANRSFDLGW